jgi:hypothetical protein
VGPLSQDRWMERALVGDAAQPPSEMPALAPLRPAAWGLTFRCGLGRLRFTYPAPVLGKTIVKI